MNPDMPDEVILTEPTPPEKPRLSEYPRLTELHIATCCLKTKLETHPMVRVSKKQRKPFGILM
ncbi:hypothetical protein E4U60_007548 [Claviceps pazoutovae]|uniref:Uncharacterized protein n=1 Tax=Claviceps pazoutovae TaxID=1649127 RepID=A0A9P7MEK0_9HYPO|nr:hypothetical protein E4U60_007548 [Claviceps pazoutovae]